MPNQNSQNTTITSAKMRPHKVNFEELSNLAPALKRSREEANSVNISRVNDQVNSTQNQASMKMEARLTPTKCMLVSLLSPLSNEHKELVTTLTSKGIEVLHCKRRVEHHTASTIVHPSSIRFTFNLTCKTEYKGNEEFKTQRTLANTILIETNKSLKDCMISVSVTEM